jgi:hypothetical protein
MTIDRAVMAFAATVALAGLALAQFHSSYWLLLPTFVGLNLLQAAVTGFCPLAILLKKAGMRPGAAFD